MVAEALDLARETYLAIVLDRSHQGPVLVGSPEGGVDIEEVAEKYPDKIFKVWNEYNHVSQLFVQFLFSFLDPCRYHDRFNL